jgi:hypothetical protein
VIDSKGVASREIAYERRKGQMDLAGLGRIWSCDRYDKLKPWSFPIYGFIGGYFRFLLSIYCDVDKMTDVNPFKHYLVLTRRERVVF